MTEIDYVYSGRRRLPHLMSLLPPNRDIPKRRKLAVRLALQQVLIEEGSGESDRIIVLLQLNCSNSIVIIWNAVFSK